MDITLTDDELDHRIKHITSFIESQCVEAGVDGVVLGLSGGIDSSTTAGLASMAIGPSNVKALILPAAPTTDRSVDLAWDVAQSFELQAERFDMEPIVNSVADIYPGEPGKTALGNVRARVRAVYWYLIANEESRLVLGGGNRTEWLTGYFTKHGDIAVDCLPLGNLYKGQVRQIAAHIGVPETVVKRTPTAELWEDQTDEAELGIDYDTLDAIIAMYVDGGQSRHETIEQLGIDEFLLDRVEALIEESAHKRRLPPTPA